jgi:hypothetical protein
MANGRVQEDLILLQTWHVSTAQIDSTVVVSAGFTLSGTKVSIAEKFGETKLAIHVTIPGSQRFFSVGSPCSTFVFGSEFTFEDFRFFLPDGHNAYSFRGSQWIVDYPTLQASHLLDEARALPLTTEWTGRGDGQPVRTVTSTDFREISGVVMPGIMSARKTSERDGEQSSMLLGDVVIEN